MKDIQTFKLFKLLVRERNAATYKGKWYFCNWYATCWLWYDLWKYNSSLNWIVNVTIMQTVNSKTFGQTWHVRLTVLNNYADIYWKNLAVKSCVKFHFCNYF
jgi:hypothetical protein